MSLWKHTNGRSLRLAYLLQFLRHWYRVVGMSCPRLKVAILSTTFGTWGRDEPLHSCFVVGAALALSDVVIVGAKGNARHQPGHVAA
ncbi:hypothetical protein [Pseudomonas matsuisoli]|uniref:hypothetical protein n=1 Tax=Pseudomonas matsuisoli TaxID=1515666 RepID=UPI0016663E61|nr:hypothetical protein [Pseudomonas matsuisoli]